MQHNNISHWNFGFLCRIFLFSAAILCMESYVCPKRSNCEQAQSLPCLKLCDQPLRSLLYPKCWTLGYKIIQDEHEYFLNDYSYAGYKMGEGDNPHNPGTNLPKTTPSIHPGKYYINAATDHPLFEKIKSKVCGDGITDCSPGIQDRIDKLGKSGGGVLYLPPGTYRLAASPGKPGLKIQNNVVLKGAGPDRTFLFYDQADSLGASVIVVRGNDITTIDKLKKLPQLALKEDASITDTELVIEYDTDIKKFNKGDWIYIVHDITSDWLKEIGYYGIKWKYPNNPWQKKVMGIHCYRKVVDKKTDPDRLVIDVPLRFWFKERDNARIYKVKVANNFRHDVGIEDLSIGMRENNTYGFGIDDNKIPGTGAYKTNHSNAILLDHTYNCWVKNVGTYKPHCNKTYHIHSCGLQLAAALRSTVKDCNFEWSQNICGGANGYLIYLAGCEECLITKCQSNNGRHGFLFAGFGTSGNVIHKCESISPSWGACDFHGFLTHGNLVDNTTLHGDYLMAEYRDKMAAHGIKSSNNVFWNITGLRYHPNKSEIIESYQYQQGYVIGTQGLESNVVITRTMPDQTFYDPSGIIDWLEFEGLSDKLVPQSLYQDQLARRFNIKYP